MADYPDIEGHQDITEFATRHNDGLATDADLNFSKLCKVAGLDPFELNTLFENDERDTRTYLANRAGATVTRSIRKLWKDKQLKVRFNLDGRHFDTLISDPNSSYDVEINLDNRSRGFQWFFGFYIVFAADTMEAGFNKPILLLDEPGLYLHAKSQNDLLHHLDSDFPNQIIYTTHSPFMVPTHRLDSVRTVNFEEEVGTTVSNDPNGDARTLFPLQAALGYDLAQSLFVSPNNLLVEGVTDFWIISAISDYLNENGRTGLSTKLTITPAGGAQKVPYMVALLTSENLNVLVLLDEEKDARSTKADLVKGKLLREQNVIFISSAFAENYNKDCDIEDVLDEELYLKLVQESYAKELKEKQLVLNTDIPRIAKRLELSLGELGISFHKTRPARLFLKKMAEDPSLALGADCILRFEKLFAAINIAFRAHLARDTKAFDGIA